ncbi:restriction endonuclease subunit S [Acinetobacter pollinis]|uniref:restriction endonuclease subunit S n=1 Tax=Acinetobacter pollinis TaxID=2605270 RepID=UPI0018C1F492|nr:restriction endonuclease subunit S [Acinetobacter pollinis]MBF7693270.1 restriction endonuclease subunit S [Acinetobacter pollinis]MBF7699429.1 restriction endonuclease subunit S [Acinetobacter pollinis]
MAKYQKYAEYKDSGVEWLGEIPSHWEFFSLKRAVNKCTNGFWGAEPNGDNDLCVLRVADFNRNNFEINLDKLTYRSILSKEAENRLLKKGDLLIEKSGGGEKTLVGCVVQFNEDFPAITSNFVAKMTPSMSMNSRYITYAFSHLYAGRVNFSAIKQTTGIQNLDSEAYLMEKFCFPSKNEQTQIANFLDHETAKIDTLIAKQQKLIELLKEKRQAVISHAVTKGLNPNVKMKASGVEWLGDVPEHWATTKLKYIAEQIVDAEHKTAPYFDDGQYLVCRTTNVRDGELRFEGSKYTNHQSYMAWTQRAIPYAGDILFTREAPAGEACVYDGKTPLCLGQRMVLFKLDKEIILPEFLLYSIYSGLADNFIKQLSQGSTVTHFNMADIQNIPLFELPIAEQEEIVLYIISKLNKFKKLVDNANTAIQLMQERRTALISAAVTGKIDVRHWKNPNKNNNQEKMEHST